MAVRRDSDVLDSVHMPPDPGNQLRELGRHRVADSVRNIQRGSARLYHGIQHTTEKVGVGPGRILRRKLDVVTERLRQFNRLARLRQALLASHAQFVLQMNVRRSQKYVDARTLRQPQGFPGPLNVRAASARQAGNDGTAYHFGDRLHRPEVTLRGDREPGLDHVHTQAIKLVREPQFLLLVHAAPGRLLAVSQRGVENRDPCSLAAHADLLGE